MGPKLKKEVLSKRLKDILQAAITGKEVWIKKSFGTLLVDKRPVCSVAVLSESSTKIIWFQSEATELGIDQAAIESEFEIVAGGRGAVSLTII